MIGSIFKNNNVIGLYDWFNIKKNNVIGSIFMNEEFDWFIFSTDQ